MGDEIEKRIVQIKAIESEANRKAQKELEELKHKNIMEEIEAMRKSNIVHFDRTEGRVKR
jgi:hypothetical protein